MTDDYRGRTPVELLNFFRAPGGHSLLIKGDAGTGKTTLALQMIEELAEEMPDHYISTRVSDEALYRQFPWLEDKARKSNLLTRGRAFLNKSKPPQAKSQQSSHEEAKLRAAKDLLQALSAPDRRQVIGRTELLKLEGMIEAGEIGRDGDVVALPSEEAMIYDLGTILPELDLAYDLVEMNLPNKTFLVVDSIDALGEHYGVEPQRIMNAIQKDLVEDAGANVCYVMETSDKNVYDYLGDGVVRLYNSQQNGRKVRELVIEKLRGLRVDDWKHIFTLLDGRLTALHRVNFHMPDDVEKHTAVKDPSDKCISTGSSSMDDVLGGLPCGGVALLEIGDDVPPDYLRAFEHALIADQLAKKRGLVWFPLFAPDYGAFERCMRKLVGKDPLSSYLRILDAETNQDKNCDFVAAIEGSDAAQDLRYNNLKFMLGKAEEPYLSIIGYDAAVSRYGENALSGLLVHVQAMKRNGHAVLMEATSSSPNMRQLAHHAQLHFRLDSLAGTIMLCGVKPHTQYYYLDYKGAVGKLVPNLVPIV
ncbi:MAG TPA: gas vesicle protein GvpD P-loop domain-containing protein [Methanomassiliicoccales archaeon]|nr:gas vesicle protein GvpD P-loop domain-containing protein [Methanomassiliicoccales archaeon]